MGKTDTTDANVRTLGLVFDRAEKPPVLGYADRSSNDIRSICRSHMALARDHIDTLEESYGRRDHFEVLGVYEKKRQSLALIGAWQSAGAWRQIDSSKYFDMLRGVYVVKQRLDRLESAMVDNADGGAMRDTDLRIRREAQVLGAIKTPAGSFHLERALWATDEAIACLVQHGPLVPARTYGASARSGVALLNG